VLQELQIGGTRTFAGQARKRLRTDSGGFRRDYLRVLAQRVEVDVQELGISDRYKTGTLTATDWKSKPAPLRLLRHASQQRPL
jgi:hypothetical protein